MEEIIYSQNNNSTISCYSMDFSGISKQNAPHLFHRRLSSVSVGRTVYIQKQKQRLVSKLPDRCFCFDFAWLVTLNLVCRKYPKNNEFRTKKCLNQGFLYGISSFCIFSENNSFLHGKISCFCIFFKNCQQSTPSLRSSFSACSLVRKWMPWIPCSSAASTFFKVSSRNTLSSAFNP